MNKQKRMVLLIVVALITISMIGTMILGVVLSMQNEDVILAPGEDYFTDMNVEEQINASQYDKNQSTFENLHYEVLNSNLVKPKKIVGQN